MLYKKIADLLLEDIQSLIENKVPESKTLEYKSAIKIDREGDRKDFLYNVSSFANALGGDIIFGVAEGEEKGIPASILGIEGNMDELSRKVESIIRDGIDPRILNIELKSLPTKDGKSVFIIHIPRSFNQPHQVTFLKSDKFYSRSNSGKYIMDIHELRNSFLLADSYLQRIKTFVKARIADILANNGPLSLDNTPKMVLHLVPLTSIDSSAPQFPLPVLRERSLFPLGTTGYNQRYNMDGVLRFRTVVVQDLGEAYLQLFRTGILETVDAFTLKPYDTNKLIHCDDDYSFEFKILGAALDYKDFLRDIGVQPPVYFFLSLLNVKEYRMGSSLLRDNLYGRTLINKEHLHLPEFVIHSYADDIVQPIKEWFDMVWNASGYESSFTFGRNRHIKLLLDSLLK